MLTPQRLQGKRGFSLIELAVVLVVLALISAVAIPTFQTVIKRSELHAAVAEQTAIGREALALVAFGESYESGFLAALNDAGSAAPGVWADQRWDVEREPDASGDFEVGNLRYLDDENRVGWVVRYKTDMTIACLAKDTTVDCWNARWDMTAAEVLGDDVGNVDDDDDDEGPGGPAEPPVVDGSFVSAMTSSWGAVYPFAVAVTSDGGSVVVGEASATPVMFGSLSLTLTGGADSFIAKADSDGEWLWAKGLNDYSTDHAASVAATPDGGAVVVGAFGGTAQFDSVTLQARSGSMFDMYVAKIDAAGNWVWATSPEISPYAHVVSVDVSADGSIFVTGAYDSEAEFGGVPSTPGGFVAKLTPGGAWQWVASTSSNAVVEEVAPTADGGAYVAGSFLDTATFGTHSLTAPAGRNVFVGYVSSTGNWDWVLQAVGSEYNSNEVRARGLDVASDGGVFVAGRMHEGATFGSTTLTGVGAFVAKATSTGEWSWARGVNSEVSDLVTGPDGAVMVTGRFSDLLTVNGDTIPIEIDEEGSSWSMYVLKFDSNGTVMWASPGEGVDATPTGLDVTPSGALRVTGIFDYELAIGSQVLTSGGSGGFLASMSPQGEFEG